MADLVGQQLGSYHLVRLLGRGSFADVYLGQHLYLKTEAAVKVLRVRLTEGDVEEFLKEAQTIARLEHPRIIRVLDYNVHEGTPFLVMDYASNGTMRRRHPRGIPVPLPMIINYTRQIADALQYAHEHNLIHRDVKPENMLLGRRNDILLSDFGIVQTAQSTRFEKTQAIAGTVVYMAPEQLHGKARFASDQYALGIVVYEWLSGSPPFQGSFSEVANQHLFTPPPDLTSKNPTIPFAVENVVMSALAKDPKERFESVQAFARTLEQACLPTPFFPSASTYIPPSPILSTGTPAPATITQPAHMQLPVTPLPTSSIPTVLPISTDASAHTQLPVTPAPLPIHPAYHPTGTSPNRLQLQQHWKPIGRNLLLIALAISIIAAGTLTAYFVLLRKPVPEHLSGNGIGVSKAPDGEDIGISDGTFAFDTNRPDGNLKLQAADKLKAHDISAAKSLWQSALQQETNDAEALIYLEDQRVLASGHPHITLVVGTVVTGDAAGTGREDLQGAYVAQKEFNDGLKLPGGIEVRLLIANSGNQAAYATTIAKQIVQAAQVDKTLVGVMGWPYGESTREAISALNAAHTPMVSPTAYDDFLRGISPYFFRVIPPIYRQTTVAAQYAEHTLHAKKVALFVDLANTYSKNLAANFEQQFVADGNTIVATEKYTIGQSKMLIGFLQDALHANPDLIYFAGYAEDVKTLLAHLPTSGPFANIQVLGGEELYEDYYSGTRIGLERLHFTASAYSKEWDVLNLSAKKPLFFTEYRQDFYPNKQPTGGTYISPSTAAMHSYDATLTLLVGSSNAFASGKKSISPDDLRQGLTKITGSHAIQGVNGQISFGPDGDPVNKVVLILHLDSSGDVRMESLQGTFLVGS